MDTIDFLVRKDQLSRTELRTMPAPALDAGQVRLRVDEFALTANNITYAAFGDAMNYWGFYPAEDGWGRIPVWGFADVIESRCPGIAPGERYYGYYPMSSAVVLQPIRLSTAGFSDGAAHRAALHAVYNSYLRCSSDPFHTAQTEDQQALLRPLFITSWLIDDFLADHNFFGANDTGDAIVLLSSASSKTAYGTASRLARRQGIELVALTSAANVGFCRSLACYHRVLAYDQLDQLDADAPSIYVDFTGNAGLRKAIHTRLVNLKFSSSIGGTHVEQLGGARDLPGPRPVLFFAPAQIKKRNAEWGAALLGQRLLESWREFIGTVCRPAEPWLLIEHHRGADAVQAAYERVLSGRDDPRKGRMLSLADG